MMTFLLFVPTSTKWLGWRKDRKSQRDLKDRFCDIYCAVILRYSFVLQSSQVDLLAKSEICNGTAIACDAAGVTPVGGSGGMLPQEILKNGST